MYLLLLKINTMVAIFKCLQKIFCKEKAGLWSLDSSVLESLYVYLANCMHDLASNTVVAVVSSEMFINVHWVLCLMLPQRR